MSSVQDEDIESYASRFELGHLVEYRIPVLIWAGKVHLSYAPFEYLALIEAVSKLSEGEWLKQDGSGTYGSNAFSAITIHALRASKSTRHFHSSHW